MKTHKLTAMLAWASLTGGVLTSCICDEGPDSGQCPVTDRVMVLSLAVEGSTRANPTPGDDGDGRLPGSVNESDVNDVNIFVYNNATGLEGAGDCPISYHIYAEKKDLIDIEYDDTPGAEIERKFKVRLAVSAEGYEPKENDYILVLANYGMKYPIERSAKIKDLANKVFSHTWIGDGLNNPYECTGFMMSTARNSVSDGRVNPNAQASKKYPNVIAAETYIERMASRIDWMYKDSNEPGAGDPADCLSYLVETKDGEPLGNGTKIYLQKILPVNMILPRESGQITDGGVYMLKHLTENTTLTDATSLTDLKWCVTEGPRDVVPQRYVVEPRTISKLSNGTTFIENFYGATAAASITAADFASAPVLAGEGSRMAQAIENGNSTTEQNYDFNRFMVFSYCHENTQHQSNHSSDFVTGLALKCIYRPAKVYGDYDATTGKLTEDTGYETGGDLWRYSPTSQSMSEREAVYFSNVAALNKYAAAANHSGPFVKSFYAGACCYYNVWLRHANTDVYNNSWRLGGNDPHRTFPMEYGIVRNNIYRIGVSFTGPGTPDLELREPDNARFRIFVRKWNLRQFPTVDIEL